MLADALDPTIEVTDTEESGALRAALCAGLGVGVYYSLDEATESAVGILRSHEPEPENRRGEYEGSTSSPSSPICVCKDSSRLRKDRWVERGARRTPRWLEGRFNPVEGSVKATS